MLCKNKAHAQNPPTCSASQQDKAGWVSGLTVPIRPCTLHRHLHR